MGLPVAGLLFLFSSFFINGFAANLEPMLKAENGGGLVSMGQATEPTPLVALAAMDGVSGTSPTELVAMETDAVGPEVALVAMENNIEPAANLVAMEDNAPTQVALVPMVGEDEGAEPTLVAASSGGFGDVVGPVAAYSAGYGTGVGGVGLAQGQGEGGYGGVGGLPPVGAAQAVPTTLASVVREAAQPKGSGSEVLMSLKVNRDYYPDVIVAYRNNALQGDILVPLSAMSAALGLGVEVDGRSGMVTGWLTNNNEPLVLDINKGELTLGQRTIALKKGQVAVGGEEIFISGALLAELMGGDMVANFRTLELTLNTPRTLPMQAAKARAERWAQNTASNPYNALMAEAKIMDYPFASLPIIGFDYSSSWAREFGKQEGLAQTGDSLNMQLQGTLFYATANFGIGLERDALGNTNLTGGTLSFSRDAPSPTLLANWLGPLAARRIDVGDIGATSIPLSTLGGAGRGVRLNNTPAGLVDDPERFVLEGDAPAGWDVEVYQNAGLLAFQKAGPNNRYRFQTLPLRPGVNEFRIVIYGPRGEQETRTARYMLGDAMLAQGQFTYDVSLYEPSVPVFAIDERKALEGHQPTLTQRYAYGVTSNITAVLAAYTGLSDNENTLTAPAQAVAAGLRGTLLDTYWQTEALAGNDGTQRFAASMARQLPWGIGARTGFVGTYGSPVGGQENERIFSLDLNKAVNIADVMVDNAVGYRRTLPEEGDVSQALQIRTGLAVAGFGFTNELEARWRTLEAVQYNGDVALTRSLFGGQARVALTYRPNDSEQLWKTMDASYQRTLSENLFISTRYQQNLQGEQGQRYSGRLDYQLDDFTLGLTAYGDARGDYGGRLSLRTQLQPGPDGYEIANALRSRSAGAATVKLVVFVDENGNQVFDPGEPPVPGVKVINLSRSTSKVSNPEGELVFNDIPSNIPVRLDVDMEEIPDIYLVAPKRPLVVFGQAGAKGEYVLPLQRLGEVNGTVVREERDGQKRAVAGLQLIALDQEGKVLARTNTESDGYFVLGNLPLGTYQIAIDEEESGQKGFTIIEGATVQLSAKSYLKENVEVFVINKE